MDDMFEEVLAICLDRLADGDGIESCVADFPECPDLRALLGIATTLTDASAVRVAADPGPTWLIQRPPDQLRPTG